MLRDFAAPPQGLNKIMIETISRSHNGNTKLLTFAVTPLIARSKAFDRSSSGVVTLSLIDWNLPTAADFDVWHFKGLACRSIVHIGPISLNVTMPPEVQVP